LSRLVKKNQFSQKYKVDLGYVYVRSGDESGARKHFEQLIRNVPLDREAYVELAESFVLRNQLDYGIRVYQKGKKTLKGALPLHAELAELYSKSGNISAAVDEYLEMLDEGLTSGSQLQSRLQDLLAVDPDNSRNEMFRVRVLERIRKHPDRVQYPELLLWYFIQRKEFGAAFIQARSLDRRQNEDGRRVFDLGRMAVENADYDAAIECYDYLISRGESNPYWFTARIESMNARFLKITKSLTYTEKDLLQLEKEYADALGELGVNAQTLSLMRNLAHIRAFFLAKSSDAIAMLENAIKIPGANPVHLAECKLELADILLMTGDVWEATLLYAQVEKAFKNEPIGAEAKFRNAKLSFYIGEFEWARAQLDVLKAATSKLIANDAMQLSLLITDNLTEDTAATELKMYARADMLLFRNMEDDALATLDSIKLLSSYHPLIDDVLLKKAEIMLRKRNYAMADSLLRELIETFPHDILADDALFKLAELQEIVFKDKERAMELYKKMLEDYPGSLFAVDSRKRFRALRGDLVNP
jgi:tetratricopeptide (TPR) repeat protein